MEVERCLEDFREFCREGLRRELRPYQVEPARAVLRSVLGREGHTIAILMARQAGKNELIACLALWMILRLPGIKIGIYAPTFPQAIDIGMRRIKRYLRRLTAKVAPSGSGARRRRGEAEEGPPCIEGLSLGPLAVPKPEVDRQDWIELPYPAGAEGPFRDRGEGSILAAHSAEKDAEKEGFTWDLIVLDEAQDLDRAVIDEEISPMGSSTIATEVYIGTPYSIDCKFYDVLQAVKEGTLAGECFEYGHEAVAAHVPEYARFVQKKARELGRDSVAFRTQYCLEWVRGLGLFFEMEVFRTLALPEEEFLSCWAERRAARDESGLSEESKTGDEGRIRPPSPGHPVTLSPPHLVTPSYAVGIDLAGDDAGRTGRTDYTAIAVVRTDGEVKTLVDLHQWRGKDWERQFGDIVRILQGLPGRARVAIDATGMGEPFSDRVQKALVECPVAIERVKLSLESKSQVGLYAEQEIAGGRVFYAAGPDTRASGKLDEFLHEVRWLVRECLPDKAVRWYVSADKGHDDLACAFFLALWASRRGPVCRPSLADLAAVDTATFG